MSKFILIFVTILIKSCSAADTVNITCEYKIIPAGLVYIEGQQYECNLQNDFPYIDGEIEAVIGDHIGDKFDTDVTILTINDKKIFEIPNLSSDFTGLKYINILKSSLKTLKKENVANFKEILEHLVIRSSNIEIIKENVFEDMIKLITIDLRNNKIFYIEFNQFSSLTLLKNFLLEGNECFDAQTQVDIKNILISDTFAMADFITKIETSTCGILDTEKLINVFQASRDNNDLDAHQAEENFNTLFDTLGLRNDEIEKLENQLIESGDNITALTDKYQNATAKNDALKLQIKELEEKSSELEAQAEKCIEINGTCRFVADETYGYSCVAHNININASGDVINWSGEHVKSSGNANVTALIIRDLVIHFMPIKIGDSFSNLKILMIRNCGLKKLSKDDFITLEGLKEIQINGNEITSIDSGVFDGLTSLEVLDLSENKIKILPSKIFALLKTLISLNLSNNFLTALRSDYLPTTNVISSFIGWNNKLAIIESAFVWRLRSATLIDFSGNDCNLKFDKEAGDQYIAFYNSILKKC
ncbi:hypothetical protein ACKWTF_016313 [Chironomus riparius]